MIVGAVGSCNLCGSGSGGMKWLEARIIGLRKFIAGSKSVGSGGHDDTEMYIVATSAVIMNISHSGIELFLELANVIGGWFYWYGI